jgi:hypothetical protein
LGTEFSSNLRLDARYTRRSISPLVANYNKEVSMPVSKSVEEHLLEVTMRHVTRDQWKAIKRDLYDLRGDASFRASVERLIELAEDVPEDTFPSRLAPPSSNKHPRMILGCVA